MNKLSSLIKKYQTIQNINRSQLAKELGYLNIVKGLRKLDSFINSPTLDSDFSIKLKQSLSIPNEEYKQAISQTQLSIKESRRENFKPSLRIILSGRPTPLIAGSNVSRFNLPKNLREMSFEGEMETLFNAYKENQIDKFKDDKLFLNSNKNYDVFIQAIEKQMSQQKSICWAFGNGYQYFRAHNEILTFDRAGQLVKAERS